MDVMEDIFQPPAYAGYQHEKFAIVEIIPEAYKEHLAYIASLNVDGYQEPEGLVWQYDGIDWPQADGKRHGPLKLGERVIMPLTVANHGIKSTRGWHHINVISPDTGQILGRKPNYRTAGKPMLRIVEVLDPGTIEDMVRRQHAIQQPAATPALCPWCGEEIPQGDFKQHVQQEHFGGLAGENQPQTIEQAPLRAASSV